MPERPKPPWRTITLPGRARIEIPARPMRIVAANSGAADILSALIGVERFAAVPAQVDQYAAAQEFWKLHPEIPRFEHYRAEVLLGLRPDLVVTSAFQDPNTTALLKHQNIPVLSFENFETFDGIRAAIEKIGEAVGEEARARETRADFDARLKRVAARLEGKKPLRVLYYSNYGSGFTIGAGGSQDEILRRAGGQNAAAKLGLKGPSPITFEQILRLDPDAIVVCGLEGRDSAQAKLIANEPALSSLRAIKSGRIAAVPGSLFDALSPQVVDAVEILARQLYPEVFLESRSFGGSGEK